MLEQPLSLQVKVSVRLLPILAVSLLALWPVRGAAAETIQLHDGSVLVLKAVTGGTNHLVYKKFWHSAAHQLPFVSQGIKQRTEPFGWHSSTPSLAFWATWTGLTPQSPDPELVLVDVSGKELPPLECKVTGSKATMITIDKIEGLFGLTTNVPNLNPLKVRVYQPNLQGERQLAAEFTVKNPLWKATVQPPTPTSKSD